MTKEKLSKRDQATEIIQLLREGRSDEAMRLFEKYGFRKEFIGFTMKSGINKEDAKDLVQEFTIDKLTMQSDSIKDIELARTWMYQVLRNMVNDKGRVLKKNREVPFDEDIEGKSDERGIDDPSRVENLHASRPDDPFDERRSLPGSYDPPEYSSYRRSRLEPRCQNPILNVPSRDSATGPFRCFAVSSRSRFW